MRKLLRPTVLIPAIVGAGLLAALLFFGNVARVVAIMRTFQHIYLLYILLLLLAYEAIQYTQWHLLLRALGVHVPQRAQAFAFLVGASTKVLPIGNFFENYLLLRASGTDFGFSSSATLLSVLIEVAVSLIGLVLLGLDHWTWLRPLIIIGLAVFALCAWVAARLHRAGSLPDWLTRQAIVRLALAEARQFRAGATALLHPRVLLRAGLLGAMYLLLAGSTLYLVTLGLGLSLTWTQVLAVYFFSLAFGLIFPLPVDIGVMEATGVGAFLAIGLQRSDAVSVMLIMRVLSIGTALTIALGTMIALPGEVRAVLRRRSRPSKAQEAPSQSAR